VSPVKYELGFYIPEDDILQSPPWKPQVLQTVIGLEILRAKLPNFTL
jgi:hypothetical protein